MKPLSFITLLRPANCIMAAFAAFIGYSIGVGSVQVSIPAFTGMAVVFLVCGAGQAINDYFDREIDKKKPSKKPISQGKIVPLHALWFSLILFAVALALAMSLPLLSFAIAFIFSLLQVLYSAFIQKNKVFGNAVVALGTAFTLVFGASIAGNLFVASVLALSAFFANMAREIIKDAEDIAVDRGFKKTLPMVLGSRALASVVLLLYAGAISVVYLPFFWGLFGGPVFFLVVSAANLLFLFSFYLMVTASYHRAQVVSKLAMFMVLLGFFAGVVV